MSIGGLVAWILTAVMGVYLFGAWLAWSRRLACGSSREYERLPAIGRS